ncbi:HD domain-containing protein [Vibrio vulnificus]|uniref:HD domain-containing protein n=1 Tax=Vibrio vulnificus TaxID=672 RepID=UPI001A242340|nr:ATP-binding protein [Vibrio vulnificus]MCA0766324.1 ATP-binding protein [Vibrio vulnificus]HAT8542816.1 ATP-binding protein [Vibrio vulnificus]
MYQDQFKTTKLWLSTLERDDDGFKEQRERLKVSLLDFRRKVKDLVSKIETTLPGLTLHDITHLDALWDTADLICGENYPLNPLEAYVFGGAVLLHDSALCFEAYDNGIEGVRSTTTWKDARASVPCHIEENEADKIADFTALRNLHANQAEKLVTKKWRSPSNNQELYLIEDSELRNHLGSLIGKIAASHHWSIEEVKNNLSHQANVFPHFPRDWRVNPIKIACMLRCADAAHISNQRAPDFLHALIKRRGISFAHWQAQNKLASADIDQSDPSKTTLLFTSTQKFEESEAEAWWVAYDTICMIDKEIRSSNALLESMRTPTATPFQVKRVKGVESPTLMAEHIQPEGWYPCNAEVHVDNIEGLIKTLGGEKLYGEGCDKLEVILRELIQNSRDSICARRAVEKDFVGKIAIHVKNSEQGCCLIIEDDGVGMSERVLTGPLLNFGTSFWASSLVQSEFPGLRSSKFKPTGRFGIGFYSVFMLANKVTVSSRQYTSGLNEVWQLSFNNGLSLRPLLNNKAPEDFSSKISTQVKIQIGTEHLNELNNIDIKTNYPRLGKFEVNIAEYISVICAALDVSVSLKVDDTDYGDIHSDIRHENNYKSWLERVSFSKHQPIKTTELIEIYHERLRPIKENGELLGLAAISTHLGEPRNDFLNLRTMGGLSTGVHCRRSDTYVGFLDYLPRSAKRDSLIPSASQESIKQWADEQIKLLITKGATPLEFSILAQGLCELNIDPIDIGYVLVRDHFSKLDFLKFKDLAERSSSTDIVFIQCGDIDHLDLDTKISTLPNALIICPLKGSKFLSLALKDEKPENEYSILGCLYRSIIKLGKTPKIKIVENLGKSRYGVNSGIYISS